jgi:hydroxymethylglutaryl-CoA lyase
MSGLPARAVLREVGLRDGIQSIGAFISTDDKVALLDALSETGLARIEATSFVHPKHVPQMADAEQVMQRARRAPGVRYEALVPNVRGAERAIAAAVDAVVFVTAASDAFNLKNVQMSVDESLAVAEQVAQRARAAGLPVLAGIATSFGCPYAGDVPLERLLTVVARLVELGFGEIGLADTTGMANPRQVERSVGSVLERFGSQASFSLHFHNTRGMGLANAVAGLRAGISVFDASLGGIGGCPFAPRATGNICTEDTVHLLEEMGVDTGIDLGRLIEVARQAQAILGLELPGQVMKAGPVVHAPEQAP